MFDFTMRNVANMVNNRKFRKIILMKPVDYYDKVSVDRETREFYVTESGWDVIKAKYLDRYDAFGYGRTYEIDENNLIIFVDLKKEKDEEKKAKKG